MLNRTSSVYVSHATGTDKTNCGSHDSPCKTLVYSLGHLLNGGSLFLDGTDTQKHPYTCGPTNKTSVDISLTISSWYAQAHISCEISFHYIPPGQTGPTLFPGPLFTSFHQIVTGLRVTLKNLFLIRAVVSCYGVCFVDVSDSIFSNCNTALRLNGSHLRNLNVTNTTFYNNGAAIDVSNAVPGLISIANSTFYHNGPQPVINICNILNDNNMHIQIYDCVFQDNNIFPYLIAIVSVEWQSDGIVTFYRNTVHSNVGGGVYVDGCFNLTFENLSMNNTASNALMVNNTLKCYRAITMKNCLINGTMIKGRNPTAVSVTANQITMSLDNVTVQSNKGIAFSFSAKIGILCVNNSVFAHNSVKDIDGLFLFQKDGEQTHSPEIANEEENTSGAGDSIVVEFYNTLFIKNRGLRSIIRLSKTSTRLSNVTFEDNIVEGRGGDIYIGKNNIVSLHNSRFTRSLSHYYESAFVYSVVESNSSLSINDSSFESNSSEFVSATIFDLRYGINISTDNASSITCPLDRVLHNTINITQGCVNLIKDNYKASCDKCQVGFYNLDRVYFITDAVVNIERCLACPYGGNCSHGIVARPNFWGYLVSKRRPTKVAFNTCPLEYCGPTPKLISSYNSCYGNRSGFLCGQCREGYTEAMFSTECRERETCNDYYFWFFSVAYIICLSFLLMTRPRLFEILWKKIVWFRHRNGGCPPRNTAARDWQGCNSKHFDHAVVKTIFYFYQIVELLLIATSSEDLMKRVKFIRPMVSVFNFEIRSWNEKFGCPFPGLTVVTKKLFSSLTVFGTIACISTTCLIHAVLSFFGCLSSPRINLYLAAGVETLLLGYERLTEVSLSLLNCVPVKSEWRLFLDGNIHCWQWWQYVLVSYIVVFVVPFIFVLYWGSRKLNQRTVSTKELTVACLMPLPLLFYWGIRHCLEKELPARRWRREDTEEIKIVLQEPFRPPGEEEDGGTLYWESVLIGRRLVLLCLHSFIADPMLRLLCLDFACMAIFVHHLYKKPYRDTVANACESVSLCALVVIATFSLAEASLVSEGIEVCGPRENVFEVFEWIEIVLLGVAPACLCVLVVLAVLSQLFRLFFHVIMFFRRQLIWLKWRWSDPLHLQRPLL